MVIGVVLGMVMDILVGVLVGEVPVISSSLEEGADVKTGGFEVNSG